MGEPRIVRQSERLANAQNDTTAFAWNSQTNQYLTHAETWLNEPRLERDGRYVGLTGGGDGPIRAWDLSNNSFGATQHVGVETYFSHLASARSLWVSNNSNDSAPFVLDRYSISGGQLVKTNILQNSGGAENNNSGNWVQSDAELGGNLERQWVFLSGVDEVEWNHLYLLERAIGLTRADGSDQRLLLHHYVRAPAYWDNPWGKPSPDGKVVIFNSNMNGSGRFDLFVAEMPLSAAPL